MSPLPPEQGVVTDAQNPSSTVDGFGNEVKTKVVYTVGANDVLILARAAVERGDATEARHLYNLLGTVPESKAGIHFRKPVSRGMLYTILGASTVVVANEAIGAWRHRSGKNWATLFQGYRSSTPSFLPAQTAPKLVAVPPPMRTGT
jgi:hypothetical protein